MAANSGGCADLEGEDRLLFQELWLAAQPRLSGAQLRAGREQAVFPARDEEKVFGPNLPAALTGRALGSWLGWLTAEQAEAARGVAAEAWQRGAETLEPASRRMAEACGLLAPSDRGCAWHPGWYERAVEPVCSAPRSAA